MHNESCRASQDELAYDVEQSKPEQHLSAEELADAAYSEFKNSDELMGGCGMSEDTYFGFCEYDAVEKRLDAIEKQKQVNQAMAWANKSAAALAGAVYDPVIDSARKELAQIGEEMTEVKSLSDQLKVMTSEFEQFYKSL